MSKALDVYKAYIDSSWSNPPASLVEAGSKYLSDDFSNIDKDGNVLLNKEGFIGMGTLLHSAFTDFKWVTSEYREEGNNVIARGHFEGTHTGDMDLSSLGLGVVPPSGKKIIWPESTDVIKIKGEKIVSTQNISDSNGMESFLAAMGVKPPSA
jgi:predicted ester cyclase